MSLSGRFADGNAVRLTVALVVALKWLLVSSLGAHASDYSAPWRDKTRAIILDAYEKNPINWEKLAKNKQVVGFIGKASDGLPPKWGCRKRNKTENTLCKKTFQNYWLKKELYKTRRMVAKSMGLKWGAYHLGRPGNPIDQANHFVDFTDPSDDDLLALDIEHDDPEKWISLRDAETFVKHVKFRTGRYPILYTNHDTAKRIAARRAELPVLSRLPLWYARYRSNIKGAFPMGHWESYAIWQFSARANCNKRRCLYRVAGTQPDIDVNVSNSSIAELEELWPFGGLVPKRDEPANDNNGNVLLVSNEPAKSEAKPVVRFKTDLDMTMDDGEVIKLASIAVPSPRAPVAKALGFTVPAFEIAELEEAEEVDQTLQLADLAIPVPVSAQKGPFAPALEVDAVEVALPVDVADLTTQVASDQTASISQNLPTEVSSDAVKSYESALEGSTTRPQPSYGYSNKARPGAFVDRKYR